MTSQWQSMWEEHDRKWRRLDELEERMDESIMRKRRRLANLLDEMSTHRRSRLRLFITHSVPPTDNPIDIPRSSPIVNASTQPNTQEDTPPPPQLPSSSSSSSNDWKLLIEGRLLVGHLDHKSATRVELEAAEAAGVDPDVIVKPGTGAFDNTGATAAAAAAAAVAAETQSLALVRSTDRTQYRGISEKEGDEPVHPILFTHFFDKVTVSFQTIYQPPQATSKIPAAESKTPKKSRGKKRNKNSNIDPAVQEEARLLKLLTTSGPTKVLWTRQDAADAQAFSVAYSPEPPPEGTLHHGIVATISLYPRPSPEEAQYRPSPILADALFPQHAIYENGDGKASSKKRKSGLAKKRKRPEDEEKMTTTAASEQASAEIVAIPTENKIVIPSWLTLQEIVTAISVYANDHALLDEMDRSSIINDKVLATLFECERMGFAELEQRLLDRKLITKANEDPVILTYVMKRDNASSSALVEPQVLQEQMATAPTQPAVPLSADATPVPVPAPVLESVPAATVADTATSTTEGDNSENQGQILSIDMDVNVPGLFHYRTRELMRRIKRREFEYTSSRTKARNMLVTSKASEDIVKTRIEEAVCGRGFTPDHVPIWLALAKAAPPGSEARAAAQIDAKMCVLLERLDQHCQAAKAAWEVVYSCRQVATVGDR